MSALPDGVTAVIGPQHERVKALLAAVGQQTGGKRATAFYQLRLLLALHETAEEQVIHPQVQRLLEFRERAFLDRIAEEQTAAQAIRALEGLDVDSDQFNASFGPLAASVTEHAAAEESDEWPALRQISDPVIITGMLAEMRAAAELTQDPSAPGPGATFSEMQASAKSRLPASPGG
jgi:hemerythrin superfamily protein